MSCLGFIYEFATLIEGSLDPSLCNIKKCMRVVKAKFEWAILFIESNAIVRYFAMWVLVLSFVVWVHVSYNVQCIYALALAFLLFVSLSLFV